MIRQRIPFTFKHLFNSRDTISIAYDNKSITLLFSKTLSSKPKVTNRQGEPVNERLPMAALEQFIIETLPESSKQELYKIYARVNSEMIAEPISITDYHFDYVREILSIIKVDEVDTWVRANHVAPSIYRNMNKNTKGKSDIITYDEEEYFGLVTMSVTLSALLPPTGELMRLIGKNSSAPIYVLDAILENFLAPSLIKYLAFIETVMCSNKEMKMISSNLSEEGLLATTAISTLFGKMCSHDYTKDDNYKNMPTKLYQVMTGKSGTKLVERTHIIGGKKVSPYDNQGNIYPITPNIIEELNWISETKERFLGQVYRRDNPLTQHQSDLFDVAIAYMHGFPTPGILSIMGVLLSEFFPPEGLNMIGQVRPTKAPEILFSMDTCRATAFMLLFDDYPILALMIISASITRDIVISSDDVSVVKIKKADLIGYDHVDDLASIIQDINEVTRRTDEDFVCILPGHEGVLEIPVNLRSQVVEIYNKINSQDEDLGSH